VAPEAADSLSPRQQLERACAELRARLRHGEDCRAEEYLTAFPSLAEVEHLAVEVILTEFVVRQQLGQAPRPEEWLARFPRLRERLQSAFAGDGARLTATAPTETAPAPRAPSAAPAPGATFGRYELQGQLGKGGMGVVFRAWDPALGRAVALKMIRDGALATEADVVRFDREAKAAARLHHPNIVPVYDVGDHQGQRFFTMAVAEGCLSEARGQYRDPRAAAALVETIARAVHYAHEKGVIHRDLKPGNVLVGASGEPLVADFGLARLADRPSDLTRPGQPLGTLAYMAPEQIAGRPGGVTERIDTWALGVILYELLTGRRPFRADDSQKLRHLILGRDPPDPVTLVPALDPGLARITLTCLEKEPARRYASAGALADDLRSWLDGGPVAARPGGRLRRAWQRHRGLAAVLLIVAVAAVALGLVALARSPRRPGVPTEREPPTPPALTWDGSRVVLVGDTGRPARSEWVGRSGGESESPEGDGAFTISGVGPSVLRLVRTPGRSYHLSALVRQNVNVAPKADDPNAEVGLCFLLGSYETLAGTRHCYCTWTFNDLRLLYPPGNKGDPYGAPHMTLRSLGVLPDINNPLHEGKPFVPYRLMPQDQYPPFRPIAVTVTPEWVELFWDNKLAGKIERRAIEDNYRQLKSDPLWKLGPEFEPAFGPDQDVGLFVYGAEASFKQVVIEPYSHPENPY
jgi:predicted Ser/Thr protein kinase